MIDQFLSERYSEDLFTVSEQEHDEVMAMIATEDSTNELESENFVVRDGKVYHKPEPPSCGRIGGFEL
jgi:hypothetical protein